MQEDINKEWMDEYEINYSKYKDKWDYHYQKVREFLHLSLENDVKHWGFIGVTNRIPEIDSRMLNRAKKMTLLDINLDALRRAKLHLESVLDYQAVHVRRFDNTSGFVDVVLEEFVQFDEGHKSQKNLIDSLTNINYTVPNIEENEFDFITHLGLMDYYLMPIFTKYCPRFQKNDDSFLEMMQKLNGIATSISIKVLYQMLKAGGHLIISTPFTRKPEGESCNRSLFWAQPLEEIIIEYGFEIVRKSVHIWEEFPDDGHIHDIINICCKKPKKNKKA